MCNWSSTRCLILVRSIFAQPATSQLSTASHGRHSTSHKSTLVAMCNWSSTRCLILVRSIFSSCHNFYCHFAGGGVLLHPFSNSPQGAPQLFTFLSYLFTATNGCSHYDAYTLTNPKYSLLDNRCNTIAKFLYNYCLPRP